MDKLVPLFIICTAVAVMIQAGILVALFVAVRKTSGRVEALATEVTSKALPTIDTAQQMLVTLRPRVEDIVANVEQSARIARGQMERLDATVSDIVDRTRLQVIRADELVNRTMDRVEETTEMVHRTVVSPIRQLSGLMQGLSTGLEFFLGRKRRHPRDGMGVPQDELFI
jgi:methyl-accepting chemotaxis protein